MTLMDDRGPTKLADHLVIVFCGKRLSRISAGGGGGGPVIMWDKIGTEVWTKRSRVRLGMIRSPFTFFTSSVLTRVFVLAVMILIPLEQLTYSTSLGFYLFYCFYTSNVFK